jgi:hypothetical protein
MPLDFVQETDALKSFALRFVLSSRHWEAFSCPTSLSWQNMKFDRTNAKAVPAVTGIYAFIVENRDPQLPPHGYVMYIGITKTDGGGNLRKRYGNYINEKRILKRPKIHYMLNKWEKNLYFYYAEVSDPKCDIGDLEQRLCDAMIPPYNQNDFSAKIRKQVRAFRD